MPEIAKIRLFKTLIKTPPVLHSQDFGEVVFCRCKPVLLPLPPSTDNRQVYFYTFCVLQHKSLLVCWDNSVKPRSASSLRPQRKAGSVLKKTNVWFTVLLGKVTHYVGEEVKTKFLTLGQVKRPSRTLDGHNQVSACGNTPVCKCLIHFLILYKQSGEVEKV